MTPPAESSLLASSPADDEQPASATATATNAPTLSRNPGLAPGVTAAEEVAKTGAWHQSPRSTGTCRIIYDRPMATASDRPRIGFVGLGIMGTPMSGHLVDAGYAVTVFDIDPATSASLVTAKPGLTAASSPAELAARSDVVFTMLPDGRVVREVALGTDGLVKGLAPGSLLVDTSSSQPWITAETAAALAAAGVAMVDAPVSGAQWGAQAAELVFMVGGAGEDVARVRPMLEVLGRAVFHLGPLGSGHMMKCINNTVTAMTFQATLEGLALGAAAGLDPVAMNDVFNESTAGSWITRNHIGQRILSRHVRRSVPAGTDAQRRRHRQRSRDSTGPRPPDGDPVRGDLSRS